MTTEKAPEALAKLQTQFAAHIRDPENVEAPDGIEDRRMAIYRDLFFNNIRSFLSNNFPVLRSLYNEADWTRLCRDFYTEFRCHTPLFPEIPREFLRYLQDVRKFKDNDPEFMLELAHYEWVELALTLDESDIGSMTFNPDGDLLDEIPVLSPLAWPLSYRFPVHRIRQSFQPQTEPGEATHLLVWRQADYQIKFMKLNETTRLLLEKMKADTPGSGLQLLSEVAQLIGHPDPQQMLKHGSAMLSDLKAKGVILGTR